MTHNTAPSQSPQSTSVASSLGRRSFLGAMAATAAGATVIPGAVAQAEAKSTLPKLIVPPTGKSLLISCKLTMIAKEVEGKKLTLTERLKLAGDAGFDGVDFDEAGAFTIEEARQAVLDSGVFCHNAIDHAHWKDTLTNADPAVREKGIANISHCLRVAHAIGGSGTLIVIGRGSDGSLEECEQRVSESLKKLLPLAASLGQPILIENVWNQIHYDHAKPASQHGEQSAEQYIKFIDSFNSPWIGMYYDIGNHWKYGQPRQWLNEFGRRAVKLDVKGFSRAKDKFTDITGEDDDLPWGEVQAGLKDINFNGWATAEVGGGGLERLTKVREQMQKAFGLA